jgi:hypothetical protein
MPWVDATTRVAGTAMHAGDAMAMGDVTVTGHGMIMVADTLRRASRRCADCSDAAGPAHGRPLVGRSLSPVAVV